MAIRSTHLCAIGTAASAPASGTYTQLTLTDPNGNAITGNMLPQQCTRVQFVGTGYNLYVDKDATPTWQMVAAAQAQDLDVVLGGAGKKVAVSSATTSAVTTVTVYFYC